MPFAKYDKPIEFHKKKDKHAVPKSKIQLLQIVLQDKVWRGKQSPSSTQLLGRRRMVLVSKYILNK
jgi:hypothetical protein